MGRDFSLLGALQFSVVVKEGLREHHKLLDIGCGPLRGGKFFINYLAPHGYFGIEPNEEVVRGAMIEEVGGDMSMMKAPSIIYSEELPLADFGEKFDYILAHSVFTHMPIAQIVRCMLRAKLVLAPKGKFLFSVDLAIGDKEPGEREWKYPGTIKHTFKSLVEAASTSHLSIYPLPRPLLPNFMHSWFCLEHKP